MRAALIAILIATSVSAHGAVVLDQTDRLDANSPALVTGERYQVFAIPVREQDVVVTTAEAGETGSFRLIVDLLPLKGDVDAPVAGRDSPVAGARVLEAGYLLRDPGPGDSYLVHEDLHMLSYRSAEWQNAEMPPTARLHFEYNAKLER